MHFNMKTEQSQSCADGKVWRGQAIGVNYRLNSCLVAFGKAAEIFAFGNCNN
jgi:hypothetical protein